MSFPLLILFIALASACAPAPEPPPMHLAERRGLVMGSELHLTAWTADDLDTNKAFEEVFADFERLDGLMSVWRDGSDIVRLNAAAGDRPVAVSSETREVLRVAARMSEWTDGKFDVTFGALSDVWKFDHDQDDTIPSAGDIRARLPLVDYTRLVVDDAAGTAFLAQKGMRAHLGGIGKGYAVERAVKLLRERGLEDFLVQAGGDLYAGGTRGDRPWRLGINDPRGAGGDSFAVVELRDATFSTSGDYERFFMKDGVRYHHIIDPATGQPARLCRSVTIVAASPLLADGLSTGVFLLGPEKGMALIERLPDVEGVIVSSKNEVLISTGLKDKVTILHQPTDAP